MKGEWKYELEAAARGTAGTVEAQRGFTRQIGRSRRNLWIDWCQIWRKRLWFERLPVDTEGTRGRRADCDCRSWITSESLSHTNSSHSLFLLVHFHQKHLKVGLKFKKFEICEERIAELFSFLAEMQQFVHQSSTRSEEKQTETLCLILSKQFVWAAAWISSE